MMMAIVFHGRIFNGAPPQNEEKIIFYLAVFHACLCIFREAITMIILFWKIVSILNWLKANGLKVVQNNKLTSGKLKAGILNI